MDTAVLAIVISGLALLNAIILGWSSRNRSAKQDTAADAGKDTEMRVTLEYIKRGVDEMRDEMRDQLRAQGQRHDTLAERVTRVEERVTRVEESGKQAHHRIDEIRKGDK